MKRMEGGNATLMTKHDAPQSTSAYRVSSWANQRGPVLEIATLVLLTIAVRLPWIFMIPISQAPDEGAHYWVIDFLRTHLALPTLADMMTEPNSSYYGALSPFSYVPHVLCAFAMPFFNAPLAYRFGSLLMGIASVLAARGIGKELFPQSRVVALAVPLFLVFHAQLAFVNGYSNNDSTSMAVATWALYAAILAVKRGITFKSSIGFGVLSGCLALSKPTTYCLFPILLIAFLMCAFLHKEPVQAYLKKLATVASIAACISMPFFLRNWFGFNGDLLGMRTMLELWWTSYGKPAQLYHLPVVDNADWRYCAFISYVGNLGNMDKLLPSRIYKLFSLGITLALGGWGLSAVLAWIRKPLESLSERRISVCIWTLIALTFVFNFATLVAASASLNATGPPQGRYLFPAEAAIAALIIGGLSRLGRIAVVLFIALNVVATVISLTMLYPIYHFDVNIFR